MIHDVLHALLLVGGDARVHLSNDMRLHVEITAVEVRDVHYDVQPQKQNRPKLQDHGNDQPAFNRPRQRPPQSSEQQIYGHHVHEHQELQKSFGVGDAPGPEYRNVVLPTDQCGLGRENSGSQAVHVDQAAFFVVRSDCLKAILIQAELYS